MNKRIVISIIIIMLLAAGGGYALWHVKENGDEFQSPGATTGVERNVEDQTNSNRQQSSQDNDESNPEDINSGGVVDQPYERSEDSDGISSDSGNITLQSPKPGDIIGNNDSIQGVAEVDPVRYRIVDHERGVIAQGQMEVTDDKFSGYLSNIRASGETGTLEVYYFDTKTGTEKDRVEIEINFR